jgi:hypothetical protein
MNTNMFVQIQNAVAQIAGNWGILSFLFILIISITIGEIFRKFFKNRILGLLVSSASFIWICGEMVKGKTIAEMLVSIIASLAFFIAVFIVAVQLFLKKLISKNE